jgi:hypothetical protein
MEESQNQSQFPESKSLRVNKKMFYFDCGSNVRGSFLKVSEVNNRYRSSITIPDNFITQFRDLLNEYVDKIAVAAPPAATQSDETQSESK